MERDRNWRELLCDLAGQHHNGTDLKSGWIESDRSERQNATNIITVLFIHSFSSAAETLCVVRERDAYLDYRGGL